MLRISSVLLFCGTFAVCDAATTIGDVFTVVGRIENKVENVQSRLATVQTKVNEVNGKSDEIVTQVRTGVNALTGNVRSLIDDAIVDAQQAADEQLAGLDDFVANEATGFRAELLAFIDNMETMSNQLISIVDCPEIPDPSFDLGIMRELLGNVPDRVLYPVFKIYDPKIGCLLNDSLADLSVIFSGLSSSDTSDVMLANAQVIRAAARALQLKAYALALSAKIAEGVSGEFGDTKFDIGIHGYVHLEFETNIPLAISKINGALSSMLNSASQFILNKLEGYELQAEQELQEQRMASILSGLTALDTLASSAATQSSVDALSSSITSSFSTLQTSVANRASQTSMDEFSQRLGGSQELVLRMRIEAELIKLGGPLSVFYLPEANGGLLETVRSIAAETITQHASTGLYAGTEAQAILQEGDDALAISDYRAAFDSFRQAYREAVNWPITVSIQTNESGNGLALNWNAEQGKTYTVEASENLVEWDGIYSNLEGADGQAELMHIPATQNEFYRVSAVNE